MNKIANLIKVIKEEFAFFLIITILLLQNTIFSWRDWTFFNVLTFTTTSLFFSYLATSFCYHTKSKIVKCILYFIFTCLCFTNIFLRFQFHTRISPNIIQLLIETNIQESTGFIKTYLYSMFPIICLVGVGAFLFFVTFLEKKKNILFFSKIKYLHEILITITFLGFPSVCFSYFTLFKCKETIEVEQWVIKYQTSPMDNITNLVYSIYDVYLMNKDLETAIVSSLSVKEKTKAKGDSLTVILVIGESFNKYHSNIYGYYLNTNPKLFEEKKNGRLYAFTNVFSPYNLTSKAIKNMLSTNCLGDGENWADYPFFPSIFYRAGYNVDFWDNQYDPLSQNSYDFSLNSFLHNPIIKDLSYTSINTHDYKLDHELINNYYSERQELKSNMNFIIFHLMGQHFLYYDRFPHNKEFDHYTTDSIKQNLSFLTPMSKKVIADYDNATRYNDSVVGMIINHYKTRNAVLIYLSDHGEEIFDYQDRQGRSWEKPIPKQVIKYQYEIPFFIWCSDIYQNKHPDIISNILSATNKPFSSDNLCHVLFHLGQIETMYYKAERDLISPTYKCPRIIINNVVEYKNEDFH